MTSLKTQITTPLVEETKAFYIALFSMVVVQEWDSPGDRGVILEFSSGSREAMLEIYGGEASEFPGLMLQFRVRDVDEFVGPLDPASYEGPEERPWGSRYVYMTDPNGIELIVYDGGW